MPTPPKAPRKVPVRSDREVALAALERLMDHDLADEMEEMGVSLDDGAACPCPYCQKYLFFSQLLVQWRGDIRQNFTFFELTLEIHRGYLELGFILLGLGCKGSLRLAE